MVVQLVTPNGERIDSTCDFLLFSEEKISVRKKEREEFERKRK